jgi:hypothetical protein
LTESEVRQVAAALGEVLSKTISSPAQGH